jgi:hypothetical protein
MNNFIIVFQDVTIYSEIYHSYMTDIMRKYIKSNGM